MSIFRSRAAAFVLAAVCVAGSMALNTRVKLGAECRKVEDSFYSTGTNVKSIDARLDQRADAANGAWTIAVKYGAAEAADLSTARQVLLDARENRDIPAMYDANEALSTAFAAVQTALSTSDLAVNDQSALADYATAFAGAQKMIDESTYNSAAQDFIRSADAFPANVLAALSGVELPELYQ